MSGVHDSPTLPRLPRQPWLMRASSLQIRLLALGAALFVFLTSLTIDLWLYRKGFAPVEFFSASDALAALLTFLFVSTLVSRANERRRLVHQRLRMIAEVNHHIRNALAVIQMSAHSTRDQEAIKAINEGITRIEWVLTEVIGPRGPKPQG